VHAVLWYIFMHPYKQSDRYQVMIEVILTSIISNIWTQKKNIIKLHVQIFLRMKLGCSKLVEGNIIKLKP